MTGEPEGQVARLVGAALRDQLLELFWLAGVCQVAGAASGAGGSSASTVREARMKARASRCACVRHAGPMGPAVLFVSSAP